jgi:hypothetical protein
MHLIRKLRKELEPWGTYPISSVVEEAVHNVLSAVIKADDEVNPLLNNILRDQPSFDRTTIRIVKTMLC